ncbi:MAG: peptidyl-prolyl isomerase H (cyclophilin H) [Bacillariaceae sp.]|jgi:peptidyl-prolyl isomerase H (cyclophilin H)
MVVGPDPAVLAAIERGNVVVFFDIALGESGGASTNNANSAELGRIKMELFTKDCPKTCEKYVIYQYYC